MADHEGPTEEQKAAFAAFGAAATQAEQMLWEAIDAGEATLSPRPVVALMALAANVQKLWHVGEDGRLPERVVLAEKETRSVMTLLTVLPDWEPSPRWPFSKGEMHDSLKELG